MPTFRKSGSDFTGVWQRCTDWACGRCHAWLWLHRRCCSCHITRRIWHRCTNYIEHKHHRAIKLQQLAYIKQRYTPTTIAKHIVEQEK